MQCPEAKDVPANSSQSTGFIEFSEPASHMFPAPRSAGLHLITPQQGEAAHCHCLMDKGKKEGFVMLLRCSVLLHCYFTAE